MNFGLQHTFTVIAFGFKFIFLTATLSHSQQKAFPGAEGFGQYTVGGRGGDIYEVTNLNDSGPGSLREAIGKTGPRTIVFRVSGTIRLKSRLSVTRGNLTIAGQSAPGDGICLRDFNFTVKANEVIIRYLRFRLGDVDSTYDDDAFDGENSKNVILDHCSISWSIDETLSAYSGIEQWTVQWCFIAESLRNSHHVKGAHGYGGIWGGKNTTWHHNLLAHHSSRNPRFDRGVENVDHRNNVVYNWTFNSCYGGEANEVQPSRINVVANYYKAGPSTSSGSTRYRIVNPSTESHGYGKWYINENYVDGYPQATTDNWAFGVQGVATSLFDSIKATEPFPYTPIVQHQPEVAYRLVLKYGGASLPKRDTIDKRIVWEVENGVALFGGKTGARSGIIDSQSDVGGWPLLATAPPPMDTDHDGMPDAWEQAQGLNPADPGDRNLKNAQGYTKLEEYLNSLVTGNVITTTGSIERSVPSDFVLYQNYPNPFNPETLISISLSKQGVVALRIYDLRGVLVKELMQREQPAGHYTIRWDGKDTQSRNVASGVYIAQLVSRGRTQSRKLLLVR
ncbi:MAG: T9SS type A sorting domain-containing protein [bacterium]